MKQLSIIATLLLTLVVGSPSFAQNLLTNPGFELGYTGWFTFGSGARISADSTDGIYRSGAQASKVFGEFSFCPAPIFDVGGYGQMFTPTPGNVYEFSGFSYVSSTDSILGTDICNYNRAAAKVVFFDSPVGGFELGSNEIVIGDYNTTLDQWNAFTVVSGPAPVGAERVEALILFLQPACDTGSVYVDDLVLVEQTPPATASNIAANPSFDTDLSGWTQFGNVFYDGRSFFQRTSPGSAKLFGTFSEDNDSGIFQSFPAYPGADYTFELFSLVNCRESPIIVSDFARAKLQFRDSGGVITDSVQVTVADSTALLGTWGQYSLTATAPTGADSVDIYILYIQPSDTTQSGAVWIDDVSFTQALATGIGDDTPKVSRIDVDNYPNPFNPTTTIRFVLPEAAHVTLEIYDVSGALVATLVNGPRGPGVNTATWNATNDDGDEVSSGVYFYKLRMGADTFTRSMTLLK